MPDAVLFNFIENSDVPIELPLPKVTSDQVLSANEDLVENQMPAWIQVGDSETSLAFPTNGDPVEIQMPGWAHLGNNETSPAIGFPTARWWLGNSLISANSYAPGSGASPSAAFPTTCFTLYSDQIHTASTALISQIISDNYSNIKKHIYSTIDSSINYPIISYCNHKQYLIDNVRSDHQLLLISITKLKSLCLNIVRRYDNSIRRDITGHISRRLDDIFELDNWEIDEKLPSVDSFSRFIAFIATHNELRAPAITISTGGNFVCSWLKSKDDLVRLEFIEKGFVRWLIMQSEVEGFGISRHESGCDSAQVVKSHLEHFGVWTTMLESGRP